MTQEELRDSIYGALNRTIGSIPWLSVIFFLFMTLKLTSHIDWSWWWVTAPLWAVPALVVALVFLLAAGVGVLAVGAILWDCYDAKRRDKQRLADFKLREAKASAEEAELRVKRMQRDIANMPPGSMQ